MLYQIRIGIQNVLATDNLSTLKATHEKLR